jgi:hypothetical protein
MISRIALVFSVLALLLGAGGMAAATDYGYVPFGPHNSVSVTSTYAEPTLSLGTTYQYARNAIVAKNYLGQNLFNVSADGQIKSWYTSADQSPRLVLASAGYSGADSMIVEVGSSPVASITAGGEFESYNYYFCCDDPRFSVRDHDDKIVGGIASGGALITAQHVPPYSASVANGEARIWFDPTPGTGGLRVTARDSDGNLTTTAISG